jgi:endonuclease-3
MILPYVGEIKDMTNTKQSKNKKVNKYLPEILNTLDEYYSDKLPVTLDHENAWELLVATILSAQCTDARVNIVTPALFKKYPTPFEMASADILELEDMIHSVGFYHAKAGNLIKCAKMVAYEYGGNVPKELDALTSLPGVGRKTANVIRGNIYGIPSIVVDTHVKRISKKLGLTENTDPTKVEYDLMDVIPEEHWIRWNIQLINFGRSICKAPTPLCEECPLNMYCPSSLIKF